jgi:DNA-binding GntR family transcriptional regulator
MGLDMDDTRSPYLQVADALRGSIQSGTLAPGDRLPTVTDLADEYGVAKMTVQKAIAVLRDEGLVVSWQGRGTFVRDRAALIAEDAQTDPFSAVMRRLDDIYDQIERLDERLTRLEQPAKPRSG